MATRHARSSIRRYLPLALIGMAVVGVVAIIGWFVVSAMGDPVRQTRKNIQQVQIIRPPPPPPEALPPPPPEVKEEVKAPEPEDTPEETQSNEPPPSDLGLDADGVAGGDAFGLLARKGGRDLIGASDAERFGWYGNVIKNDLLSRLSEIRDIRREKYSIVVRLWLGPDGKIERFNVVSSTGNKDLDRDLMAAIQSLGHVSEQPPHGLPQPIRVRIVRRS